MKNTDRAYLAGILDGEGCISLTRQRQQGENRRRTVMYSLSVSVVNRSEELIYWLTENFGGSKRSRQRGGNRSLIHEWHIYGRNCAPVLEAALPYLKVKRDQAELALEFINTLSADGTRVGFVADHIHEERDILVTAMGMLNERGG